MLLYAGLTNQIAAGLTFVTNFSLLMEYSVGVRLPLRHRSQVILCSRYSQAGDNN